MDNNVTEAEYNTIKLYNTIPFYSRSEDRYAHELSTHSSPLRAHSTVDEP